MLVVWLEDDDSKHDTLHKEPKIMGFTLEKQGHIIQISKMDWGESLTLKLAEIQQINTEMWLCLG